MRKSRSVLGAVLLLVLLGGSADLAAAAVPVALFDNAHAQTAGNADWTVAGGYSDLGDTARFLGCVVRSQDGGRLSEKLLADATVLVSPEPNRVFSADEQAALRSFLERGGSALFIADHANSDRDGDGIDSVGVINQLAFLGISVNVDYFSEAPATGAIVEHPITHGVVSYGTWGGASLSCPEAGKLIFGSRGALVACGEVGRGRVVVMGDSSPFDDGSGQGKLYDGFNNPGYTNARLAANIFRWLLRRDEKGDADALAALAAQDAAGRSDLAARLTTTASRFQKVAAKAKTAAVKATWAEDVEWLNGLLGAVKPAVRDSVAQRNFLQLFPDGR